MVVVAVQKGERPNKPANAGPLGFSSRLWRLVVQCWDESPSTRPTAQDLFRCLQDISPTWVPPLEYPVPDGPDGEAGPDFVSRSERIMGAYALATGFFALSIAMLCVFILSLC